MSILSRTKKMLGREEKDSTKKSEGGARTDAAQDERGEDEGAVPSVLAGQIGLSFILSEKSIEKQEESTLVFRVRPEASKGQIMQAVRETYEVTPIRVRTARYLPKKRRRGRTEGRTNHWKKAYVTVDDVQKANVGP